jgi:hypothetical protein
MHKLIPLIGAGIAFALGTWLTGSSTASTSATTPDPVFIQQEEATPEPGAEGGRGFDCPEKDGEGGGGASDPQSAAPSDDGSTQEL